MTLPLRAFVMLREAGEWSVQVCRDWEAIQAAWRDRSDSGVTGVLHVGFDRPASSRFEALASIHPGRMLLTGSARCAVPEGYEASDQVLGFVDRHTLHLGTRGWGYQLDAAELASIADQSAAQMSFTPTGWVSDFIATRPDLMSCLAEAGVQDDASYLASEDRLSRDARCSLARFRLHALAGGLPEDPCEIARLAPPWLSKRAFNEMVLSARVSNVLINMRLERVEDLGCYSLTEFLKIPNFGRKSGNDLCQALVKAWNEGPIDAGGKIRDANLHPLRLEIHRTLGTLEEREREILTRRMGFERPQETLQSIAEYFDLTRERIRQIEAKVIKTVIRDASWDDLLTGKLGGLLSDREYPLPVLGIDAADPWFQGFGARADTLGYLISNFCRGSCGIITVDGIDYLSHIQQTDWDAAVYEASRALEFSAGKGWTKSHCQALVRPILREEAKEFRALLWQKAADRCHFTRSASGDLILTSFGRSIEQIVEAVLADAEQPLHYSEIATRAEARAAREVDARTVYNAAASVGILLGPGTYGARRHIDVVDIDAVRQAAENIILRGVIDRQWHASEILLTLQSRGQAPADMDKYVLDYILSLSSALRSLGRMVWVNVASDANERVDIRKTVIELLEEAGKPLSYGEIYDKLVEVRGLNPGFQIHPGPPLARLDDGRWGLAHRDAVAAE